MVGSCGHNEPGGVGGAHQRHNVDNAEVTQGGQHHRQHGDAAPDECPAHGGGSSRGALQPSSAPFPPSDMLSQAEESVQVASQGNIMQPAG